MPETPPHCGTVQTEANSPLSPSAVASSLAMSWLQHLCGKPIGRDGAALARQERPAAGHRRVAVCPGSHSSPPESHLPADWGHLFR